MRLLPAFGVMLAATTARAQAPDPSSVRMQAAQACAAHAAGCDWLQTFAPLERASVSRALAARGYTIEPQPWGKTIAQIRIYNENVFAEDNWLRFFNFIHYTTRERAIRDELTVNEGDAWNDDLVAESARRLRDPLYSSVIALLPVQSAEPGKVNLLVVTRDVWSLRFNSNYSFQQGTLTNLTISLSENNFLGNRDVFAAGLIMDQGSIAVGPIFIDKNLLGSHLSLSVRVDEIITRQSLDVFDPNNPQGHVPTGDPKGLQDAGTLRHEGSDSTVSLSYPLWSLASEWGGGLAFSHRYAVYRQPFSTGLLGYDDPDTPGNDLVPWEYELKRWNAGANVVRQWGTRFKQQLAFGINVSSVQPSLLPNFASDPQLRLAFMRDVFPRSELISAPYVEYSFFIPRYRTVRNVSTYELAEDLRVGPDLDVSLAQGLHFLGSDYHFTAPAISLGYTVPWCDDGWIRPSVSGSLRIQDGISHGRAVASIDNGASATVTVVTPSTPYGRLVAQSTLATRWNDSQNAFSTIGSDSGLRGYAVNQFGGPGAERRFWTALEARSVPIPWWVLRLGGVAFYEVGGVAASLPRIPLYHDVGFGVRMLIPQTSRDLFRFDVAFPLRAAPGWPAYTPHFIAGFQSYF